MHIAVPLEREDAVADAVQEISVVAHCNDTAVECRQRFFQNAQRRQVQIVRRLVQDQEVPAVFQYLRKQEAASLAAGELPDERVHPVVVKEEPPQVFPHRQAFSVEKKPVPPVADFLHNSLLVVQRHTRLVHIIDQCLLADLDLPFRG